MVQVRTEEKHLEAMLKRVEHRREVIGTDKRPAFMNAHGSRACHCLTRARAFAAKLKEAHALLEAERIEAFSTADQEPPADRAAFQNPLGSDGGEDADEEAAEDENGLSKT